jgi:CHAT domain-containing protein
MVVEEIEQIRELGDFVDVLNGADANRDTVIHGLRQHSWAHFACHGHLDKQGNQPFHSSFELHDNSHLTLLDLIQARLPNAEFAFLSACHSAAGDSEGTPDEVIHLAAALQFCGFRSVVGTLWAMEDIDGRDAAKEFYGYMFGEGGNTANFRDSAKALNLATRALRRKGIGLERWIKFVHIGA